MVFNMETQIQDCSYWAWQTLPAHRKPSYGENKILQHKDIVHEPSIEFWNIDTQFGRARKFINHPTNLPAIKLDYWRWTLTACK